MKKRLIAAGSDLLVAALLLGGIYGVNYLIPQKGVAAGNMAQITEYKESSDTGKNTESMERAQGSGGKSGRPRRW